VSETRIVSPIPSVSRIDSADADHAGLGQAEVQRLVCLLREIAIDRHEIARPRQLARDDDLVLRQAGLEREIGRLERGDHHARVDDLLRRPAQALIRVRLHVREHELLIQRSAVDADAHRFAVIARDLTDRRELLVAPASRADVARIDAVLVERPRRVGISRQQQVAVVVKVPDERRDAAGVEHALLDLRHRRGRVGRVHRDAHHLRPGLGQFDALPRRRRRVRRVRHRHALDDDGGAAADLDAADHDGHRPVQAQGKGHPDNDATDAGNARKRRRPRRAVAVR
jgi:hypothetical protein